MKGFINKISKGSKLALFFEILLLLQIITYAYIYITRPDCSTSPINEWPGHLEYEGGSYEQ